MSLADYFPRTSVAYPQLVNWAAPFDWRHPMAAAAIEVLLERLIAEQAQGRPAFLKLATLLRHDLTEETARVQGLEASDVACARFIIAVPAAHATLAEGLHGDSYSWIHWGTSATHDFDARVNTGNYGLPPYEGALAGMNALAELHLVDWIRSAYLVARKFGGMDELAQRFLDYCVGMTMVAIGRGDVVSGIDALSAMLSWATKDGHEKAERLTRLTLDLFDKGSLPPRQRLTLAFGFVTAAGRWTEQTPQQWAQRLLDEFRPHLVEHEIVQLLSVVMSSPEQWAAMRDEILSEIRTLANFYKAAAHSAPAASLALEARVEIIHPLLFSLTEFGGTGDILDVLWAWYGNEGSARGDANILFIASAHGTGVTYLWPGGRWAVPGTTADTLQALLDGISESLTDYFRGPEGDRLRPLDERMVGAPVFGEADGLRAAVEAHYGLQSLGDHLPAEFRPRSIAVLPAHRDPLQALLLERLGWVAPLEASVSVARPMRELRTVGIWPGATQLTDAEVECLTRIGEIAGWTVRIAKGPLDEAAFQRFYEDPEADALWVIGHGEQSPFRLEETGIVMDGYALLPIERIAQMKVPEGDRRLLVLNVCSGGATQNRGGLARVGLGHFLASPHQVVTAHLWPIDYHGALAFGCALGAALAREQLPQAFGTAIETMKSQTRLLALLAELGDDLQAAERLAGERLASHFDNLLNWGCPVLLS